MTETPLDSVAARLAGARHVAVLTGAGISAESGIATFRDPDGLWARFRPEELANMDAFLSNPRRVQDWYAYRRSVVRDAGPNDAHRAVVALEEIVPRVTVITQNVDGLHADAGSSRVLELHGSLARSYCVDCGREAREEELAAAEGPEGGGGTAGEDSAGAGPGQGPAEVARESPRFRCIACGGLIRPDVVWFGEMLPREVLEEAVEAAVDCDVFLSVGTSAVVYPAAGIPLEASRAGAFTAEVNVAPSAIADALDVVLTGRAGEVLPELVRRVRTG